MMISSCDWAAGHFSTEAKAYNGDFIGGALDFESSFGVKWNKCSVHSEHKNQRGTQ